MTEPTVFDIGAPGRCAARLPVLDVPAAELPEALMRDELPLPEVSELDLVRHFVRLSQLNHSVDTGFYPLGSCTMKHNPKVNEKVAALPGFTRTHPYQYHGLVQGNLRLMFELQEYLKELGGFRAVSLQPAAGAHGELTGVLMIRAYHEARGDVGRNVILVPDSAHGTNPASTTMSGYVMAELQSDVRGNVDLADLRTHCNDNVAGMMLTNPNTLGLFDEHVLEICDVVHRCGGLMYGDGANFNAIMGVVRPADLGFDVMHYNLHKTFSTPHGGGGPGAGPVGAVGELADFLPGPIVSTVVQTGDCASADCRTEDDAIGSCYGLVMPPRSIGRVKSFYGNFGVFVRANAYIRALGAEGLREASQMAVLNANYLRSRLEGTYPLSHQRSCMHEFVVQGIVEGAPSVHALDISKRLIDYGFHPPTNYFPLIVPEALMIEPTESEGKATLDAFADAMLQIAKEAVDCPQVLHEAPKKAPVRRLDEVRAARTLKLRWMANQE